MSRYRTICDLTIDSLRQVPLRKSVDARLITNTSGKIANCRHPFAETILGGYCLSCIFIICARTLSAVADSEAVPIIDWNGISVMGIFSGP